MNSLMPIIMVIWKNRFQYTQAALNLITFIEV